MKEAIDSVILAGDKKGSKPILGVNKVYLEIAEKPLVVHTLSALMQSPLIATIHIVGNVEKIESTMSTFGFENELATGKIKIIEQGNTLIENIWRCYLYSIDKTFVETENKIKENEDKQLFIVTGDSPLITTEEVDDFISNSDMTNHDYIIGLTDIQNLKRFSPNEKKGLPGIRMAPIHFKEKLYRINNLHLAKPAKVKNRHLINKLYQLRYLKEWSNMIKLLIVMKREHFKKGDFGTFFIMEFALLARKYHFLKVANYLRQFSPIERIEQVLSNILDARFGYHETPYGDSTIDVDNETDYLTIKKRWDEWKSKRKRKNVSPAQSYSEN